MTCIQRSYLLIWIFLMSMHSSLFSQDHDIPSLRQASEETLKKINQNNRNNLDSFRFYIDKGLTLANKLDDPELTIRILTARAYLFVWLRNYDSATYHFHKALKLARDHRSEREKYILNFLGIHNHRFAIYDSALFYFHQSLQLRKVSGGKGIGIVYNNIGLIHYNTANFEEAILHFRKTIKLDLDLGGQNLIDPFLNIGLCYLGLDEYDSAFTYLHKSAELINNSTPALTKIGIHNGLGICYREAQEDFELAEKHLKLALELASDHFPYDKAMCLSNLAILKLRTNERDSAWFYVKKSQELSKELGAIRWLRNNFQTMSELYFKAGDYKNAQVYYRRYDSIDNEINGDAVNHRLSALTMELSKKENEILSKEQNRKIERRNALLLISLLGLVILGGFVVILNRNNRFRKRANKQISETLAELRTTQGQLVAQEKMAALGQLVSGIAHEINTPLGAIQGLISPVSDHFSFVVSQLHHGLKDIPGDKFGMVLGWVQKYTSKDTLISTLARRNHKKRLIERLSERGLSQRRDLADKLLDIGITIEDETIESLLSLHDPVKMIDLLHSIVMHERGTAQMETVVNKISKMVSALQTYSQPNRSGDRNTAIDLRENIDHSLVLLANEFKHGIRLVKQYPEKLSSIKGNPDSLGQVWTNVLMNSIQAVEGKGTITIRIEELPESIVVKVMDDGYGIPGEARDKIFEAFYTTKQRGYGTGLGLHISKRIVEQHGGEIHIVNFIKPTLLELTIPKE